MTTNENASQPLAGVAVDRLWQLQLRKENKAILEKLQKNENKRHEFMEANQKRFEVGEEKILRLEARIAQLEKEHLDKLQYWEKFKNEQKDHVAELKMQINQFLQSHNPIVEDEIRSIIMDKVSDNAHGKKFNIPNQTSSNGSDLSISSLQATQLNTLSNNELNFYHTVNRDIKSRAKKPDDSKHPNNRNGGLLLEHNPASTCPPDIAFTTKFPKLTQGRRQLKRYYEQADLARASMEFPSEQLEIDFVNFFIKGITSTKIRERLIGQLQQIYPSKQKKDGRIEILCDWVELGLVINDLNFYQEKNGVVMDHKTKNGNYPITIQVHLEKFPEICIKTFFLVVSDKYLH